MDAIRNRIDLVVGKHPSGDLAVFFGDPVDIFAEIESQIGQVEKFLTAKNLLQCLEDFMRTKDLMDQVHRKSVVTGGDRGVGRKNALLPDGFGVGKGDGRSAGPDLPLIEELQGEKTGMTLVHVEALNPIEAKGPEHSHSPDSKDHLLSKSVTRIPSVEDLRERPIPFLIFGKVAVQKTNGHGIAADPLDLILPRTKLDGPSLKGNGNLLRERFTVIIDNPLGGFLPLPSAGIETLIEIPLSIEKRHSDHGDFQVCGGPQCVSRQDPQAPAVGRHPRLQSNFHRKVGNASWIVHRFSPSQEIRFKGILFLSILRIFPLGGPVCRETFLGQSDKNGDSFRERQARNLFDIKEDGF
jgi:hypothetical protein